MQIILDTYGLSLGVRNKCFLISKDETKKMVHPSRVSSFLITMPCKISSPAIMLAATNDISITVCSRTGSPDARLWSSRFSNTPSLRRQQYLFAHSESSFFWSKHIMKLKLENQISNLNFIANRKPGIKDVANEAICFINNQIESITKINYASKKWEQILRYLEASSANKYWQVIGKKLPSPYCFEHRIKRQPTDAFNSTINYLYGMLRNNVETAVLSLGLDPALGIMHVDGYNRPSLVFDLIEPFRPIADRLLLENILNEKLKNSCALDENNSSYRLTQTGRKKVIALFNQKLNTPILYNKKRAILNNQILAETQLLTQYIRKNGKTT